MENETLYCILEEKAEEDLVKDTMRNLNASLHEHPSPDHLLRFH